MDKKVGRWIVSIRHRCSSKRNFLKKVEKPLYNIKYKIQYISYLAIKRS